MQNINCALKEKCALYVKIDSLIIVTPTVHRLFSFVRFAQKNTQKECYQKDGKRTQQQNYVIPKKWIHFGSCPY